MIALEVLVIQHFPHKQDEHLHVKAASMLWNGFSRALPQHSPVSDSEGVWKEYAGAISACFSWLLVKGQDLFLAYFLITLDAVFFFFLMKTVYKVLRPPGGARKSLTPNL